MGEDGSDATGDTIPARAQVLADRAARAWTSALFRAGRWADARDRPHPVELNGEVDPTADPEAIVGAELRVLRALDPDLIDDDLIDDDLADADLGETQLIETDLDETDLNDADGEVDPLLAAALAARGLARPGATASAWAVAKAAIGLVGAPVTVPAMTVAALRSAKITKARIARYPQHLHALAEGQVPPLPLKRSIRRPASTRYLITSDLHRCIPGRLDWPERQGTKGLYHEVLSQYADEDWHLIENGDVEDFWMVGGSTWGAVYDVAYLTGGAVGPGRNEARRTLLRQQLDRIVDNNAEIYALLRERFCAEGRYLRTMGNHDDAYTDTEMAEYLQTHLPGAELVDTVLLSADGATGADGIDGIEAIIAHGHLTDSWNGPGFAPLGRSITWLITGLDDLPKIPKAGGLPDEEGMARLLGGGARNRLITVDPRYGGNRRFDSLDEQRLFTSLAESEPEGGWPWIVFGHTHFPMLWPHDADGVPVKYANSGCAVLDGAFTCLEWDSSDAERPLRLIVWRAGTDGAERIELVPDGPTLRAV